MSHLSQTTVGSEEMILLNPTLEFTKIEDNTYESQGNRLIASFDSCNWYIWINGIRMHYGTFISSSMSVEARKKIVQAKVSAFLNSLL